MSNIKFNIKEVSKNSKNNTMANELSYNQMYKISGSNEVGISYKDWIQSEEKLYKNKIQDGKIQNKMSFPVWMQARWAGKMNAIGGGKLKETLSKSTIFQSAKDIGKSVLVKTLGDKPAEATEQQQTSDYQMPEKRILGMKKGVFWLITGVVLLGGTFATIKIIQKIRK